MSVTKNYNDMVLAASFKKRREEYFQNELNHYYDLFCAQFKINGLNWKQLKYFQGQMWKRGSIWIRKNKITDEPVLCKYCVENFDYMHQPNEVSLINEENAPSTIIPIGNQVVDKDGVIVFLRPNGKGFEGDVSSILNDIADTKNLINLNKTLQRCPWILASTPENAAKVKDFITALLSDNPALTTDVDISELGQIQLNTPYLIDKLQAYLDVQENKLKTLLGIDNQGGHINAEQQNLDTTNCNKDEINDSSNAYIETLKDGLKRANELLGLNLSIKATSKPVTQIGNIKDGSGRKKEGDDNGNGD